MYKIRLNDGTEFSTQYCAELRDKLAIRLLSELDFMQIAQIFNDAEKTQTITYIYGSMQDVHEGYTLLRVVDASYDGEYIISLRRAANGTVTQTL